jgi:hypothetical protein
MPHINGPDLTAFMSVTNGVHDFNEKEMEILRKAADLVREAVKAATDRERKQR